MKELIDVAADLQEFCQERGWEFCFIGGLAVQALAEPRLTRDTDMTLLTGFGTEEPFIDALLAQYEPRRQDARDFALRNRVLLLKRWTPKSGPGAKLWLPWRGKRIESTQAIEK